MNYRHYEYATVLNSINDPITKHEPFANCLVTNLWNNPPDLRIVRNRLGSFDNF